MGQDRRRRLVLTYDLTRVLTPIISYSRPSPSELKEKTPVIVSTDGLKSQELSIVDVPSSNSNNRTNNAQRELSPKGYQFDQVFGPEAEQSVIYQDVVVPLLNEVFDGYNCTIFAYGQTGTGKT